MGAFQPPTPHQEWCFQPPCESQVQICKTGYLESAPVRFRLAAGYQIKPSFLKGNGPELLPVRCFRAPIRSTAADRPLGRRSHAGAQ